jgi:hypothetical protein
MASSSAHNTAKIVGKQHPPHTRASIINTKQRAKNPTSCPAGAVKSSGAAGGTTLLSATEAASGAATRGGAANLWVRLRQ